MLMKKMLFTFALMALPLFALKAMAQETPTDTTVYEVVEKMPEYPGGIKVLVRDAQVFAQKYIKKHFPDDKTNPYWWPGCGIPARSIVTFTVHEDGQITDAIITRNVDPHCDRAALLFVKSMPRWIPGEQKGKKVKVKYTLPFSTCKICLHFFILQDC